jgi:hypothetical protein
VSAAGLLLAVAAAGAAVGAGQLALAPSEHYSLARLLELGFELKAAAPGGMGDMLYLQGRLAPGKPVILVKCAGQTIAVSATQDCRRIY